MQVRWLLKATSSQALTCTYTLGWFYGIHKRNRCNQGSSLGISGLDQICHLILSNQRRLGITLTRMAS